MSKIYDKIFPKKPYAQDNNLFRQSVRLSWTEPKHFIKYKSMDFGNFISDFSNYLKLIDIEKSPRKKLLNMNKIFNSIENLLKFNDEIDFDAIDNQIPILNYSIIKAQPLRLFSNITFMELYIGEKKINLRVIN